MGSVRALGHLVRFRLHTLGATSRRALAVGGVVALLLLVGAAVLAHAAGSSSSTPGLRPADVRAALPAGFVAFLVTVTVAAVGAGGGREIVPADQAVALPIGSTTDHLAALLWAPLSIAWVVPGAGLLAAVGLLAQQGVGPAEVVVVLWLVAATAVGQLVGWVAEWARGLPRGPVLVRVVLAVVAVVALGLFLTGRLPGVIRLLGGGLLAGVVDAGDQHRWGSWVLGVLALAALAAASTWLGARVAALAARRPPRIQAAAETRHHEHRPARSTRAALLRLDRAGVWRSAPLRRGLILLALLPLVIAVVGRIGWETIPVLPGLVASGGALLFGVNAWCLDAAGAWWRESVPVSPRTLFLVRAQVVAEVVLVPGLATLVVCAVRAGTPPGASPVVAAVGSVLVVVARIVASALRWSVRRPYAADLRRPRATPAPPGTMLGYSVRLALVGSLLGLLYATLAASVAWPWIVVATVVLLLPSTWSLRRTLRRWDDPVRRVEVVRTVAAV